VIDLLIILIGTLTAVLFAVTLYATIEYTKQMKRAKKEYEQAKNAVEDIVLSFNRELKREANRIENIAFKLESTSVKAESGLRKADNAEKRSIPFESQLSLIGVQVTNNSATINAIAESNKLTAEKAATAEAKVEEFETVQETIKTKIAGLEEQVQKIVTATAEAKPEVAFSTVPVLPIRRDKAMAALTDTEVAALEYLAAEGPKTAPEIKERVQLSREHTARLMKRLYEEGYLERETAKLPFKYSVKEEMKKLLKKQDPPTQ